MAKNDRLSWERISTYLHAIEMKSGVDIRRVREIFNLGKVMCPEELVAIFISNYIESEGKEQHKDLWLFSETYVIESLNFARVATPHAEMTILHSNLDYTSVETKNYKFSEKAQRDSTLHIVIRTLGHFMCDFLATGQNCETLRLIFQQYVKDNFAKGRSSDLI